MAACRASFGPSGRNKGAPPTRSLRIDSIDIDVVFLTHGGQILPLYLTLTPFPGWTNPMTECKCRVDFCATCDPEATPACKFCSWGCAITVQRPGSLDLSPPCVRLKPPLQPGVKSTRLQS